MIKVRHDLINQHHSASYTEKDIFDNYLDVFELEGKMKIRTNTPLDSFRYRRFVYILQDGAYKQTKQIMITPYLHERKIYLNRIKFNTRYFYTSVETKKGIEELMMKSMPLYGDSVTEIQRKKSISMIKMVQFLN